MRRRVQRAVALVCCMLTLQASAAELPKVLVVPLTVGDGAPDKAVVSFGTLIADELKNRGDSLKAVPWPMPAAAHTEKAAPKATKPPAEAIAALEAGKKATEANKFEEAAEKLKKGLDLMLADPATSDDARVVESLLALAVAAFRQGDDKQAQTALISLARWDPKFVIPPGYPPVFGREFEKAKKKLSRQPKGALSIEGPAGAVAFVDGREVGKVPVLDENLAAGPHYVRVESASGQRFGQVVDIKGGVSRVKAVFQGERPASDGLGPEVPMVGPVIDEKQANRLAVVARNLGADYLVLGWVYRSGEQELVANTALYSLQKKGVSALTPMTFDAEVLTANVEAFKVVDEIVRRVNNFGTPDSYPVPLKSKPIFKVGSKSPAVAAVPKDTDPVTPARRPPTGKTALTPAPDVRALAGTSERFDPVKPGRLQVEDAAPEPELKKSLPPWAWVAIGIGAAAVVGTGSYFIVAHANRPVTGTVTATW